MEKAYTSTSISVTILKTKNRISKLFTGIVILGGLQAGKPVGKGASVISWSKSAVLSADDSCQLPDLPEKMIESVGTVYDGRPTICGGQNSKTCYYYSSSFGRSMAAWTPRGSGQLQLTWETTGDWILSQVNQTMLLVSSNSS